MGGGKSIDALALASSSVSLNRSIDLCCSIDGTKSGFMPKFLNSIKDSSKPVTVSNRSFNCQS